MVKLQFTPSQLSTETIDFLFFIFFIYFFSPRDSHHVVLIILHSHNTEHRHAQVRGRQLALTDDDNVEPPEHYGQEYERGALSHMAAVAHRLAAAERPPAISSRQLLSVCTDKTLGLK